MTTPRQTQGAPDGAATAGTVFEDEMPEVSRVYAEALVAAVEKQGNVDAVFDQLNQLVTHVLEPNPKFAAWFFSPLVPVGEKDRVIVKVLEGRALPIVVNFLRVLNRRGRLPALRSIVHAARTLWDRHQNRQPVTVRAAVPLDEDRVAALRQRLQQFLQATPILNIIVDPSLIGGLVVQVGDDVYDASVRNQLAQLRHRLIEGKTHEIQSRRDHFSYSA
jgi:F-type H+-transporting ATPase subunit delta